MKEPVLAAPTPFPRARGAAGASPLQLGTRARPGLASSPPIFAGCVTMVHASQLAHC